MKYIYLYSPSRVGGSVPLSPFTKYISIKFNLVSIKTPLPLRKVCACMHTSVTSRMYLAVLTTKDKIKNHEPKVYTVACTFLIYIVS